MATTDKLVDLGIWISYVNKSAYKYNELEVRRIVTKETTKWMPIVVLTMNLEAD